MSSKLRNIQRIEPRVLKLAETVVDKSGVRELVRHYAANDWLKKTQRYKRSDSELLTELAGRVCYKSFGAGLNPNIARIREKPRDYLQP